MLDGLLAIILLEMPSLPGADFLLQLLSSESNSKANDITCYKCQKKGHISKDCRVKLVNNIVTEPVNKLFYTENFQGESLLTTKGHVNGHELFIGFDTGATCLIISLKTVKKKNLEFSMKNLITSSKA
jgi:hypothetical protein